jgi:HAD superfamily hydrolase (TIGR01490 family)
VGDFRFIFGVAILSHVLVAYKLKLIPNYKAKQTMLSWYFKGMSEEAFLEVANQYSLSHIDKIVRPKAMEKIAWHKAQGHQVVIVSASIDCWLRPWCERNSLELLATKLEIKNAVVTGKLLGKNCYGEEKVNRIKEIYDLNAYEYIYAYGDSKGDVEMLKLAHESFYKPFR